MADSKDRQADWPAFAAKWLTRVVAHGLGVGVVASVLFFANVNRVTLEAIWDSAQHVAFLELAWFEVALHMGLAACLWALLVIGYELVTSREGSARQTLKLERGSVMTETLVVLPIFFILTFGIAQLAINNMAGLLANAAVFQAGRAAWLWSGEAEVGRNGVSGTKVEEMARIQAAAVLTPIAPAEFIQNPGGLSDEAKQMRGVLLGGQMPAFSQDTGATAQTAAPALLAGENMTNFSNQDSAFFRTFDTSGWRQRTVRKFTFAYHSTEITVINGSDEAGVNLRYHHHQAMPYIGKFFGDWRTDVGNRPGHYATIEREFTMPKQISPNPCNPGITGCP
jgi:hypothetical protein